MTKQEQRCREFCEHIVDAAEHEYAYTFGIVWRKSRTWGYCPHIMTQGGYKIHSVNGCGYDKESAVLAQALRYLPGGEGVARADSAGLRAVQDALALAGWKLDRVYSGQSEDGFTIERFADV